MLRRRTPRATRLFGALAATSADHTRHMSATTPPRKMAFTSAMSAVVVRSLAAALARTSAQVVPCRVTTNASAWPSHCAPRLSLRRKNIEMSCVSMMTTSETASTKLKSRFSYGWKVECRKSTTTSRLTLAKVWSYSSLTRLPIITMAALRTMTTLSHANMPRLTE